MKRREKIKWKNILIFHGVHKEKMRWGKWWKPQVLDEDFPRDRHKRIG